MSSSVFQIQEHVLPTQYIREYPGAILDDQQDTLKLHIKQYTPLERPSQGSTGITIIGAHANGFPKELYEPLWEDLYRALQKRGQAIESIWIADVAHQGMSGVLNENKLGNDPSWFDHPRDLLHMINHFRKEMPRPLIGIGHSLGGNNLVNLSLIHPRLFTTLVLIDPVIQPFTASAPTSPPSSSFARSSTFRRDQWPSRADALASFKRSKFYQSWDPRVLDRWMQFGLQELPTALYRSPNPNTTSSSRLPPSSSTTISSTEAHPVTLTTTKHQEVFTFLRPNFPSSDTAVPNRTTHPDFDPSIPDSAPFYRPEPPAIFKSLPHLRPSVLYIFASESPLSNFEWREAKMSTTGTGVGGSGGEKEGRVKHVVMEGAGHLVCLEDVRGVAETGAGWVEREVERWKGGEAEWVRMWGGKGARERQVVGEEWKVRIGGDPRGKGGDKL